MATAPPPQDAAPTPPSVPVRVWRSWRALSTSQKMSAIAALALLVTMFMPWFSQHGIAGGRTPLSDSLTAFGAFSIVEAIVLLVALGVLALLFVRGENRAPGSPASDGAVILVAGGLAALMIVYGMFSAPGGPGITTGLQWGLFLALAAAIWLASTGRAMRRPVGGERTSSAAVRAAPAAGGEGGGEPLTRDGARSVTFEHPHDQYDE